MRLIDCFSPLISFALHSQSPDSGSPDTTELRSTFLDLVEQCRKLCLENGFKQNQQEYALFAVISWIDEQRLCSNEQIDSQWVHYQLQKTLFNTSSAGDEFYERFKRIPKTDKQLREVYAYCLALGFRGRMYAAPKAFNKFCQKYFGESSEKIGGEMPEILFAGGYELKKKRSPFKRWRLLPSSSLLFFLVSLGLLGGLYLFCQRSLQMLYSSLQTVGL